jgi:diacylglycerol O-acyltransferase
MQEAELLTLFSDPVGNTDSTVFIYDQQALKDHPVRFKQILNRFKRVVNKHRLLRSRVKKSALPMGLPYWHEEEDFDVERFIRHVALPKPGDWRQLSILLARLQSRPLELNGPLWEAFVVEGLDNLKGIPEGSFAIVWRVHRVLAKSVRGFAIFEGFHDEPEDGRKTVKRSRRRALPPSLISSLIGGVMRYNASVPFTLTSKVINLVHKKIVPELSFYYQALMGGLEVPYTRFNSNISSYRVWTSEKFNRDKIDEIAQAFPQVTDKDITFAIISGALRCYLIGQHELSERSLVAIEQHPVNNFKVNSFAKSDNYLRLEMASHLSDPESRLLAVAKHRKLELERQKVEHNPDLDDLRALIPFSISENVGNLFDQESWRRAFSHPLANTTVSWQKPIAKAPSFEGARLINYCEISAISDSLGLAHSITSIADRVVVSVTSCREMMPYPAHYGECLRKSFDELLEVARIKQSKQN